MIQRADSDTSAATMAPVAAAAMIANQVAAKAVRDTLFLTEFGAAALPAMMIAATVVGLAGVLLAGRLNLRFSPQRVMPISFAVSGVLLLVEYALARSWVGAAAILLYLHVASLGAVLISGFWSVVSERFEPRGAKRLVARITTGATAGGVLGAVMADQLAAHVSARGVLPVLAALHVLCALLMTGARGPTRSAPAARPPVTGPDASDDGLIGALTAIRRASYLKGLAALILLMTMAAAVIDYVLKSSAVATFPDEASLTRFFAVFYAVVGAATFVVSALFSERLLHRAGLATTLALSPALVCVSALGALAVPGLAAVTAVRGLEAVLRSSIFRSGYELVYTPIPPREKRQTKALIDVGVERLGDGLGALFVALVLLLPAVLVSHVLLGAAAALLVAAFFVARSLQGGYVQALEQGLRNRAFELNLDEVRDATTRSALLKTLGEIDLEGLRRAAHPKAREEANPSQGHAPAPTTGATAATARADDRLVRLTVDLRSRVPARVRSALEECTDADRELVPHLVALLAWDAVAREVQAALSRIAPRHTGLLVDALLDGETPFATRRRLPAALAGCNDQRAVDGLVRALDDARFEVRFRCAQALAQLRRRHDALVFDPQRVYDVVLREARVDERVWTRRKLLDPRTSLDDAGDKVALLRQEDWSLRHALTLLELVLDREPLELATQGLVHADPHLHGLGLEYLDSVLPSEVRHALWPYLAETRSRRSELAGKPSRSTIEILKELSTSLRHVPRVEPAPKPDPADD